MIIILDIEAGNIMIMNEVTIVNNTNEKITVSITNTGENGQLEFFEIASKSSSAWKRSSLQVCYVLRTDNGKTEVIVVKPGKKYQIDWKPYGEDFRCTFDLMKWNASCRLRERSVCRSPFASLTLARMEDLDSMKLRQSTPTPGSGSSCKYVMCWGPTMEILRFLLWTLEKLTKSVLRVALEGIKGVHTNHFWTQGLRHSDTWWRSKLHYELRTDDKNTKVLVVEHEIGWKSYG